MPEIARAAGIWPKFFGGYWARHPQKFSLALISVIGLRSFYYKSRSKWKFGYNYQYVIYYIGYEIPKELYHVLNITVMLLLKSWELETPKVLGAYTCQD